MYNIIRLSEYTKPNIIQKKKKYATKIFHIFLKLKCVFFLKKYIFLFEFQCQNRYL